jgi:hypothetical protein
MVPVQPEQKFVEPHLKNKLCMLVHTCGHSYMGCRDSGSRGRKITLQPAQKKLVQVPIWNKSLPKSKRSEGMGPWLKWYTTCPASARSSLQYPALDKIDRYR